MKKPSPTPDQDATTAINPDPKRTVNTPDIPADEGGNDLNTLLEVLTIKPDEFVPVCHNGGGFATTIGPASTAQARAAFHNGSADVWFGVNPLKAKPASGRGTEDDVARLVALFADLDIKDSGLRSVDGAREVLSAVEAVLGVSASAVVESGNGLHPYWPIIDGDDISRAKKVLHRFGFLVGKTARERGGTTDNVFDLARILRVPGTHNVKDKANPKPVTLTLVEAGRALTLTQAEAALDAAGVPADAKHRDAKHVKPGLGAVHEAGRSFIIPDDVLDAEPHQAVTGTADERLKGWCERVATCPESGGEYGGRNATLNNAAMNLGHLVPEYLSKEQVTEELLKAAERSGLVTDDGETSVTGTIESGLTAGMKEPVTLDEADGAAQVLPPTLPETFWTSRPSLAHIKKAARSCGFPADALLGAVLARVSWLTDYRLVLPDIGGRVGTLDLHVCLTGGSGDGKGTALDIAERLVPAADDPCVCGDPDHAGMYAQVPAGTGEGITRAFYESVRETVPGGRGSPTSRPKSKIDRRHVLIRIDEVQALTALTERSGATIIPLLRQGFSGEGLGQQYGNDEKRRRVPALSYRLALVMAVQPTLAAPLFAEVGGGTPQRLLWLSPTDPTLTDLLDSDDNPVWPGPLVEPYDEEPVDESGIAYALSRLAGGFNEPTTMTITADVRKEIRARLIRRRTGDLRVNELDTHRDLVRLKVAGLLARIDGQKTDIKDEDWQLAGMVLDTSDQVRQWTRDRIKDELKRTTRQRTETAVKRQRAVTEDADAVQRVAYVVARKVIKVGHAKRKDLRDAVGQRDREYLDAAIERAVSQRLITEDDNSGYEPGETTPPIAQGMS